jgi:GT2 family glycosyltransferase
MAETVAAIVVTYNRKELLVECLNGLLRQTRPLEALFLIDNASTDGTPEYLRNRGFLPEVPSAESDLTDRHRSLASTHDGTKRIELFYVRLSENTGGAGGFFEGVKKAYEEGYDWLWLMDDDAEPRNDALEVLLQFDQREELSALACLKVAPDNTVQFIHRGYFRLNSFTSQIVHPIRPEDFEGKNFIEIDHASFVGILVSRKAVERVGYPKKEFFIHYDDVEYCLRLRSVGKILLVPGSVIIHKQASNSVPTKKPFLIQYKRVPFEKLWLRYYHRRNLIWLRTKYSSKRTQFLLGLLVHILGEIAAVVFFEDHKFKRVKFILHRSMDGLRGNFENKKSRTILYGERSQ